MIKVMKKNMKTQKWFAAAALLACLAACSSEEEIPATRDNYPDDGVVRFSVGVNESATRASQPADGSSVTEFGISILNSNASNGSTYSYDNIEVTGSNSAGWTPSSQMLWQNATQKVNIVAYAPYTAGSYNTTSTDLPVKVETTQSKESYTSDFLVCKKSGFIPSSGLTDDKKVELAFMHALSQLTLTVEIGTEFNATAPVTANPISEMTVDGTYIEGTCDFTKNTDYVTAKTSAATGEDTPAPAAVTPFESADFVAATKTNNVTTNAVATYQCLLIPQIVAAKTFSVSFVIDGKTYTWTSEDEVTLAENTAYTLALTVGKDMVIAGGISATAWQSAGDTTDLVTE